jgi:uncharacterized membrane protein YcfT
MVVICPPAAQLAPKADKTAFHSSGHFTPRFFMLSFLLLSTAMGMKVVDNIARRLLRRP